MKLASLKEGGPDGTLAVVARDLKRAVKVPSIARTLQSALDAWHDVHAELASVYRLLNEDHLNCCGGERAFELDMRQLASPLPRGWSAAELNTGGAC